MTTAGPVATTAVQPNLDEQAAPDAIRRGNGRVGC